jgi:hypothetical protein
MKIDKAFVTYKITNPTQEIITWSKENPCLYDLYESNKYGKETSSNLTLIFDDSMKESHMMFKLMFISDDE